MRRTMLVGLPLAASFCALTVFLGPGLMAHAAAPSAQATRPAADGLARQILDTAGVQGGLIVHLGCGGGSLTAALHVNDRYLVHGLDADANLVAAARKNVQSLGLYGKVSVEQWTGGRLPYADNFVNLLVISDAKVNIAAEEIERVLVPRGVTLRLDPTSDIQPPTFTKPWPKEIDEWTHWLHDAGNNAVARDTRVGPPRRMQWVAEPLWSRGHEVISSVGAVVTARGRIIYAVDEGQTGIYTLPSKWMLVARDAFNGIPLWKQPIPHFSAPVSLGGFANGFRPRRLVTDGDRVFLPMGEQAVLTSLDAATGQLLKSLPAARETTEILCADGLLVAVATASDTPARNAKKKSGKAATLIAVQPDTFESRWNLPVASITDGTLALGAGHVFFAADGAIVALDVKTGREAWRVAFKEPSGAKSGRPTGTTLMVHDRTVYVHGGRRLSALLAASGKVSWDRQDASNSKGGLFAACGLLWRTQDSSVIGHDPASGEVRKTVDASDVFSPGHHLRCYPSKATERYVITPNRGAEFVSLASEANVENDWLRGNCGHGVMPANGLLYAPPNQCMCYPGVMLTGFKALAAGPVPTFPADATQGALRLQRGPAYAEAQRHKGTKAQRWKGTEAQENAFTPIPNPQSPIPSPLAEAQRHKGTKAQRWKGIEAQENAFTPIPNPQSPIPNPSTQAQSEDDWATYRHDPGRFGSTTLAVPAVVKPIWQVAVGGRLTPPVVAGGMLLVAASDAYTVHALSTKDGQPRWTFTAGGRIDSPPTVHEGLVLFGSADGWVYCLRAADGALAWRFRAAPEDRRIGAFGRIESAWPVHGSVLVLRGIAYVTAGRSSYLDGGILLFGLDPKTGKVLHEAHLDTWARTREDAEGKPVIPAYHIEGVRSDILVSDGEFLYLGQVKFDRRLAQQPVPYILPGPEEKTVGMDLTKQPFVSEDAAQAVEYESHQRAWLEKVQPSLLKELQQTYGTYSLGHRQMGRHVLSTSGFLDDSWFNRTFWMYSATWPGFYLGHRGAKTGQLLVVGPERTYAVQAYPSRNLQSAMFTPGGKGYLLLADQNDNEPILDDQTRGTTKGWGFTRKEPPVWFQWVPIRIRGMVLADEHLFVAGPPDVVADNDPYAAFEGRKGGLLWAVSAADGKKLAEVKLEAPPVFDGMIAAGGCLFVAAQDGRILCLGR